MNTRSTYLAVLILTLTSCSIGGWKRLDRTGALGGWLRVETADSRAEGELLLADEEGVILLLSGRVTRAPWEVISRMTFRDRPVKSILRPRTTPPLAVLRRIRLASRYPYGLSDAQMDQLLGAIGQREIRVLR